ncbi:MAG: hypothetical protein ACK4Z4_03695 [Ferrovibrio sp.]
MAARIVLGDRPEIVEALAGDEAIVLAIACSDALTPAAARLNERHDCDGFSSSLIDQLVDKAVGIPMLSQILNLPLLPQCLPSTADDIVGWSWLGPVIVKPTRSSGGWSSRPWGYRRFDDKDHFVRWLRKEDLEAAFFAEQEQPRALGPALLQAALDGSRTEGAMLLLTASQMHVVYKSYGWFEAIGTDSIDGPRWRRSYLNSIAASDLIENLPRLDELRRRDPAWGRGILHMHGIRGPDGLHLIDVNLRLTTTWDWVASVADPTAHRRLLAALLFDAPLDLPLPAPVTLIDLVNGDPRRRIAAIDHPPVPPHILPVRLTAEACGTPAGGFDKAGVMPCFVTLGSDFDSCTIEAERFRAGIRLHYAEETAP